MADVIDLRSDTVTRPTDAMRSAIANAVVGDDVYGDDPTVNLLEERVAALLGKQAAMLVPTGTQSNLCALLAHCQRGDEYIVGQQAHTYRYEAGGAAVLGSIQPQPLDFESDGSIDLDRIRDTIKPDDPHFARTRLLALENTHDGKVVPFDYIVRARELVDEFGLGFHLDGARLWNAAAALGVDEAEIAAPFDSVSVCLSKGLGAPVGSVLVGSAELIAAARRWRKMLGGAMRQAGVVAAGGLHAIDHHRSRLVDDHDMAQRLGKALAEVASVGAIEVNTNMVFADFSAFPGSVSETLRTAGILSNAINGPSRMVAHLDVPDDAPERLFEALASPTSP